MNNNVAINLNLDHCQVKVLRINGISEFSLQAFKWINIQHSASSYFSIKISRDPSIIAKFYAGLTCITGPSDELYDPWKGSYSFMFGIEVKKNDKVSKYCFHIYHCRSFIEFSVVQPVLKSDKRECGSYDKPNDTLFSNEDICDLVEGFYLYIMKRIEDTGYVPPIFVKNADSNLLLFGYLENEYFFETYEDVNEYDLRKKILYQQVYDTKKDFFSDINPELI